MSGILGSSQATHAAATPVGGAAPSSFDISKLLAQLGNVGQSFEGTSTDDPLQSFLDSVFGEQSKTGKTISDIGQVLGSVDDRLLTPRAGKSSNLLDDIQDRLLTSHITPVPTTFPPIFPPGTGGGGGGVGGGTFTPQLPLNSLLNFNQQIPPIFGRRPY